MTLKFNGVRAVVKVHIHAKYRQAQCSGSRVIVLTNVFAKSGDGKELKKNTVL